MTHLYLLIIALIIVIVFNSAFLLNSRKNLKLFIRNQQKTIIGLSDALDKKNESITELTRLVFNKVIVKLDSLVYNVQGLVYNNIELELLKSMQDTIIFLNTDEVNRKFRLFLITNDVPRVGKLYLSIRGSLTYAHVKTLLITHKTNITEDVKGEKTYKTFILGEDASSLLAYNTEDNLFDIEFIEELNLLMTALDAELLDAIEAYGTNPVNMGVLRQLFLNFYKRKITQWGNAFILNIVSVTTHKDFKQRVQSLIARNKLKEAVALLKTKGSTNNLLLIEATLSEMTNNQNEGIPPSKSEWAKLTKRIITYAY